MTYVIANWQSRFETAETRKLEHLRWCPSPNKLDGLGYKRMVQQRDRSDLFAAWNVMRAIASKTTPKESRGRLERDGRPLTAEDMALMSGFPTAIFDRALTFFSSAEIGWLERELSTTAAEPGLVSGQSPARPADSPAPPAEPPAEGTEGKEGKERREGKARARSLDEVMAFCKEISLTSSDAEWFWHKCEGNGWANGGAAIKDWRQTLRSWKAAGYVPSAKNPAKKERRWKEV